MRIRLRPITLIITSVALFSIGGCGNRPYVVGRYEAYSPDGKWIAEARNEAVGDFGAGIDRTVVDLRLADLQRHRSTVLLMTQEYYIEPIQLVWHGTDNLSIIYYPHAKPGDQMTVTFVSSRIGNVHVHVKPR